MFGAFLIMCGSTAVAIVALCVVPTTSEAYPYAVMGTTWGMVLACICSYKAYSDSLSSSPRNESRLSDKTEDFDASVERVIVTDDEVCIELDDGQREVYSRTADPDEDDEEEDEDGPVLINKDDDSEDPVEYVTLTSTEVRLEFEDGSIQIIPRPLKEDEEEGDDDDAGTIVVEPGTAPQ